MKVPEAPWEPEYVSASTAAARGLMQSCTWQVAASAGSAQGLPMLCRHQLCTKCTHTDACSLSQLVPAAVVLECMCEAIGLPLNA